MSGKDMTSLISKRADYHLGKCWRTPPKDLQLGLLLGFLVQRGGYGYTANSFMLAEIFRGFLFEFLGLSLCRIDHHITSFVRVHFIT